MAGARQEVDPYIGLQPTPDYILTEKVGEGRIGSVYAAVRKDPADTLACKVIPEGNLKQGWERELDKVAALRGVPNVVNYIGHGTGLDQRKRTYVWILWNYIQGTNLKEYLKKPPVALDMAFVELVGVTTLQVLYACRQVDMEHGDLHEGNILISDPDKRLPGSPRVIWIADFGYGGSHNKLEPKNDYRQFFSIVEHLLGRIDVSSLNARDREFHQKMDAFLRKRVLEFDPTQRAYVGNVERLLHDFGELARLADRAAAAEGSEESQEPGDYLWAEALGYRKEEWKNLFVPGFLAAQELLSKNIIVLTGARGCGKTMAFRRLTVYMDEVVGEPSGVPGADQIVGFYLNCRDLVEAFPWLPKRLTKGMKQQIIHYFHLAWLGEILKTLTIREPNRGTQFGWLDGFLSGACSERYRSLPEGADVLAHAMAFVEEEKERCRSSELGSANGEAWPLARVDFLDSAESMLRSHVSWMEQKPLCLFLDDYTDPIVPRAIQRVLNAIVFKRRSNLFFKVSTEAANSLELVGVRSKVLEPNQDFALIDLATESLHLNQAAKIEFLDKVFRPRIERHPMLKGKELGLGAVLGSMSPKSNNELARQMRDSAKKKKSKTVRYHGVQAFVGMWTSDVRTTIQMFVDMLRDANGDLRQGKTVIKDEIQDKVYRTAGGDFLAFAESISQPLASEGQMVVEEAGDAYGRHLIDIAEAFARLARYELTSGDLVSNQGRLNPKQAFRLEVLDKLDIVEKARPYYEGLIRWHIFLQDRRGKSVRGMLTPRLYLNRALIPYCNLTFSSHDNIGITNEQFMSLLLEPSEFVDRWIRNRKAKRAAVSDSDAGQQQLGLEGTRSAQGESEEK